MFFFTLSKLFSYFLNIFSQPFRPEDQFIYADADLKDYGPINYKQASIYAQMKKVKEQQKLQEIYDKQNEDML